MSTENAVVAEYDTHSETEKAVQQVQKIGFGTEESFVGYYKLATASSHGVSTALFKPAQPVSYTHLQPCHYVKRVQADQ